MELRSETVRVLQRCDALVLHVLRGSGEFTGKSTGNLRRSPQKTLKTNRLKLEARVGIGQLFRHFRFPSLLAQVVQNR